MITQGLKELVCNLIVKETFSSTLRQLEAITGEKKLLSKSSSILHSEGKQLREAQLKRAEAVFEVDEKGKRLLGMAQAHLAEDHFEKTWLNGLDIEELGEEEIEELLEEIEWDPRDYMDELEQRRDFIEQEDSKEVVMVQPVCSRQSGER
jgi:hypothetical protein